MCQVGPPDLTSCEEGQADPTDEFGPLKKHDGSWEGPGAQQAHRGLCSSGWSPWRATRESTVRRQDATAASVSCRATVTPMCVPDRDPRVGGDERCYFTRQDCVVDVHRRIRTGPCSPMGGWFQNRHGGVPAPWRSRYGGQTLCGTERQWSPHRCRIPRWPYRNNHPTPWTSPDATL